MTKNKEEFKEQQLQKAKEYAKSRGGECLSTEYISAKTKLEWKCENKEHKEWFAVIDIINRKIWCSQYGIESNTQRSKLSNELQKAQEYAIRRGGTCLSSSYKNYKSHLKWKCYNPSHQSWGASISIASNNHWCPECADKKRK